MALLSRSLDAAARSAITVLARSSWERSNLEDTWQRTGWPASDGGPVSQLVFEQLEFQFEVDDWIVGLKMTFDPDTVVGFFVEFAIFSDVTDPDEEALEELIEHGGDRVQLSAGRAEFDAAWADACEQLTGEFGAPVGTGQHGEDWKNAVWQVDDRLIVAAQGEYFQSYGTWDSAAVWIIESPNGGEPPPAGDALYALLTDGG